jgi:hypothetical protein
MKSKQLDIVKQINTQINKIMTKLKTGIYTHIRKGNVNVYTAKEYKKLSIFKKLLIKFNL